jgi:hypothetical protein
LTRGEKFAHDNAVARHLLFKVTNIFETLVPQFLPYQLGPRFLSLQEFQMDDGRLHVRLEDPFFVMSASQFLPS